MHDHGFAEWGPRGVHGAWWDDHRTQAIWGQRIQALDSVSVTWLV